MNYFLVSLERAAAALSEIGPAVLNGGFSTFLAFVCLGASGSYVFKTFFKVVSITVKVQSLTVLLPERFIKKSV